MQLQKVGYSWLPIEINQALFTILENHMTDSSTNIWRFGFEYQFEFVAVTLMVILCMYIWIYVFGSHFKMLNGKNGYILWVL